MTDPRDALPSVDVTRTTAVTIDTTDLARIYLEPASVEQPDTAEPADHAQLLEQLGALLGVHQRRTSAGGPCTCGQWPVGPHDVPWHEHLARAASALLANWTRGVWEGGYGVGSRHTREDYASQLATAHDRLTAVRRVITNTGYFTEDQIGDDLAPRVQELLTHHTTTNTPDPAPSGNHPGAREVLAVVEELAERKPDGDEVVRVTVSPIPKAGVGSMTGTYVAQSALRRALEEARRG